MEYIDKVKKKRNKDRHKQIRLSEEEEKMVTQQATILGLTVSAYIRMLIHKEERMK
jgi:predicted DNA binding CopG/RHH family protein